jgi:TonB family protein
MSKPFVVLFLWLSFFIAAAPQQPAQEAGSVSDGVALYEQGDTEAAIKVLRAALKNSKKDARAWHYLGLALQRQGNPKAAYEAFDKAIGLRERLIKMALDGEDGEWRDDQLRDLKELLRGQIESQSRLLEIFTDREARESGELALARSRTLAECVDENTRTAGGQEQVTKSDLKIEKARILLKQPPRYPESARGESVNGTVALKVVFAADASIQHIEIVRSPDSRLTEEAIRAARLIKFIPETICGKPVSSSHEVEYSFYISR